MKPFTTLPATLLAWLWALSACTLLQPAHAAPAQDLVDDRQHTVSFAAPPQRIVSLLPSLTETICALGACTKLVGVDRYSNFPASVKSLPSLGGLEDAQIERIVALKPDVVLAAKSARVLDRLEALGLKVLALDSQTHADVQRTFNTVSRLLGTPDAGKVAWAAIERDFAAAALKVPPALRGKRVYFEIGSAPYAAGRVSFIGETLDRLGMANAIPAELGPFPKLNPEFVVRAQPDVMMATARDIKTMADRPGWQGLAALQAGRVCGFDSAHYELLIRPGPRLGEAALVLADCLATLPLK